MFYVVVVKALYLKLVSFSELLIKHSQTSPQTVTLGTEERGHGREVAVMGRLGCNKTPVFFCSTL